MTSKNDMEMVIFAENESKEYHHASLIPFMLLSLIHNFGYLSIRPNADSILQGE
jgi:hypothetical protein